MKRTSDPDTVLRGLEWTVIRRLDGVLQGDYRTLFRGFGLELAELREYQIGDDVRSIDWYVTARMQTPHVRLHVEDRDLTAWFLVDVSPSVDFGTAHALKRDLAIRFVGVLARVLTRHGNKVGAIVFDGVDARLVPAMNGRMQVLRLISVLMNQPRLAHAPETNLEDLLDCARMVIRRRSLVFLISDFIGVPGWDRGLGELSRRHEVVAAWLSDPRESELPDIGTAVLEDAETGGQLLVDTHDPGFHRRFADAAVRRRQELGRIFARTGTEVLALSTEGDLAQDLIRFVNRRRRRRGPSAAAAGG